jgi:hypothetical protein
MGRPDEIQPMGHQEFFVSGSHYVSITAIHLDKTPDQYFCHVIQRGRNSKERLADLGEAVWAAYDEGLLTLASRDNLLLNIAQYLTEVDARNEDWCRQNREARKLRG